jgi:O-antigen ligase
MKPVPGAVFAALVGLVVLLPWPLGANRDWYWPWLAALAFATLAVAAAGIAAGRWRAGVLAAASNARDSGRAQPRDRGRAGDAWVRVWIVLWLAWVGSAALGLVAPEGWGGGSVLDTDVATRAILQQAFYAALALLVLLAAHTPGRLRVLAIALFATGLAEAAYASFMTLSGFEWGWLAPKTAGRGLATGTFVNRNHLAGYLALTASAGTGLLVGQLSHARPSEGWRRRARDWVRLLLGPKTALRVGLVMIVIGLVLTQSRMGNLSFLLAFGVVGAYALLAMRPLPRSLAWLLVSVIVVDLVVIGSRFGVERVAERLRETTVEAVQGQPNDAERLEVARATIEIWKSAPWMGIGAGGFRSAFPAHRPHAVESFYDHAHNDWLQILAERGVVGLVLWAGLVGVAGAAAARALRRRRDPRLKGLAFGAAMGVLAMAVHALADFNWQIPANAASYSVLMALAIACLVVDGRGAKRGPPRLKPQVTSQVQRARICEFKYLR